MFGTVMGVETEGHLQFINRFGGDPRCEDLVETLESVMEALETGDALFDGEAGSHGLFEARDACERRQIPVGLVGVHGA